MDALENLHEIFLFSQEKKLPLLVISGGTNILFSRDFFPGIVLKNSLRGYDFDKKTKKLTTFSGESITELAKILENIYQMPIWHRFIGLPGAVAGAVVGNAGCFGLEIQHNFESAEIFDMKNNRIFTLTNAEMHFDYRFSILKNHPEYFVTRANFDLGEIRQKYESDVDNIAFRETKQPKNPSCGSFFKNPSREVSAGFLIESVGLKGQGIGGALWSDIHANFLISADDSCRPEDLMALVRQTQKMVAEKTGYCLENEVRIIE